MEDKSKIIARLQKLLELAERGGTEAEADNAMQRVQEILTKYNLSMGDVNVARDKDEMFEQHSVTMEWNQSWIPVIYHAIADLYFCDGWNEPNGTVDRKVVLIGKPVNVYSALYVAKIVVENGRNLARAYAQHAYSEYGMNAVSASNNFKKGYASRINARCHEMIKNAKSGHVKDVETGTALVVADLYERTQKELTLFREEVLKIKLSPGAGMRGARDQDAAGAGRAAADKQNLRADGIEKSNAKTMLLR